VHARGGIQGIYIIQLTVEERRVPFCRICQLWEGGRWGGGGGGGGREGGRGRKEEGRIEQGEGTQ